MLEINTNYVYYYKIDIDCSKQFIFNYKITLTSENKNQGIKKYSYSLSDEIILHFLCGLEWR